MPARISRQYLSDDSLGRAIKMISAQVSNIGTLTHRYRDDPEVTYALGRDDDALCDVLGILLAEQRARRFEDAEQDWNDTRPVVAAEVEAVREAFPEEES